MQIALLALRRAPDLQRRRAAAARYLQRWWKRRQAYIARRFCDYFRRLGCPHLAYIAAAGIHHGPNCWCRTPAGVARLRGLHRAFGLPASVTSYSSRRIWPQPPSPVPPNRRLGDWDLPPSVHADGLRHDCLDDAATCSELAAATCLCRSAPTTVVEAVPGLHCPASLRLPSPPGVPARAQLLVPHPPRSRLPAWTPPCL